MKFVNIEYLKFLWTCNKTFYPNRSFLFHIKSIIVILFENKTGKRKIKRIDNLDEYMSQKENYSGIVGTGKKESLEDAIREKLEKRSKKGIGFLNRLFL